MARSDADALRRAYAGKIMARAGVDTDPALFAAFATVPRENFLGEPPWLRLGHGRAVEIGPDDLGAVYADALFALDADKGINNGEPSLHAQLIGALAPKPGASLVHVGAGTGYYTAILAELVGPTGHVVAIEADARLGEQARQNLAAYAQVELVVGDGASYPRQAVDGVYVSFAVAAPAPDWIEHLKPGGRLIFPLGLPGEGRGRRFSLSGAMLLVTCEDMGFSARFLGPVAFIFASGAAGRADPDLIRRLERAFATPGVGEVKSLIWRGPADPERCWFWSEAWSLCYDVPAGETA